MASQRLITPPPRNPVITAHSVILSMFLFFFFVFRFFFRKTQFCLVLSFPKSNSNFSHLTFWVKFHKKEKRKVNKIFLTETSPTPDPRRFLLHVILRSYLCRIAPRSPIPGLLLNKKGYFDVNWWGIQAKKQVPGCGFFATGSLENVLLGFSQIWIVDLPCKPMQSCLIIRIAD